MLDSVGSDVVCFCCDFSPALISLVAIIHAPGLDGLLLFCMVELEFVVVSTVCANWPRPYPCIGWVLDSIIVVRLCILLIIMLVSELSRYPSICRYVPVTGVIGVPFTMGVFVYMLYVLILFSLIIFIFSECVEFFGCVWYLYPLLGSLPVSGLVSGLGFLLLVLVLSLVKFFRGLFLLSVGWCFSAGCFWWFSVCLLLIQLYLTIILCNCVLVITKCVLFFRIIVWGVCLFLVLLI